MKIFSLLLLLLLSACSAKIATDYGTIDNLNQIVIADINTQLINQQYLLHYYSGMKLAVKEINKNGGINGVPLKLIRRNDYNSYAEGYIRTKEVIQKNRATIITGSTSNLVAAGISKAANEENIPFIATGVLSDELFSSPGNIWSFRVRDGYDTQRKAIIEAVSNNDYLRKFVIIRSMNSELEHLAGSMKHQILHDKSNATFYEDIVISSTNLTDDRLAVIERLSVDAVIVMIDEQIIDRTIITLQKHKLLKNKKVFFMQAGEPEWFSSIANLTPNNWVVTGFPWYAINTTANINFVKMYNAANKVNPRYSSYIGYITIYYIAEALKNSDITDNKLNKNNFLNALKNTSISTALGDFYMKDNKTSSLGTYIGNLKPHNVNTKAGRFTTIKLDVRMFDAKYIN